MTDSTKKAEPVSMAGSIAANLREGSRSEYLAHFVFSSFGTAIPVPHQEDSGLDIYCTLFERVGQRAWPRSYYSVQVKSTMAPRVFGGPESVRWLRTSAPDLPLYCAEVRGQKREAIKRRDHGEETLGETPQCERLDDCEIGVTQCQLKIVSSITASRDHAPKGKIVAKGLGILENIKKLDPISLGGSRWTNRCRAWLEQPFTKTSGKPPAEYLQALGKGDLPPSHM